MQSTESGSCPISTVAVMTRNRPYTLKRCLHSLIAHLRGFDRSPRIIVIDSSEAGESPDLPLPTGQDSPTPCSTAFPRLHYITRSAKEMLAMAIARESALPEHLVRFALLGADRSAPDFGANLNALMLLTAGEGILKLDDDVILRTTTLPQSTDGYLLSSRYVPEQFVFFRDMEELESELPPCPGDLIGAVEKVLGRSISECAANPSAFPLQEPLTDQLVRAVLERTGFVRVAVGGVAGDLGFRSKAQLLFAWPSIMARRACDENQYRLACTTDVAVRAAPAFLITDSPWCMAGVVGLDNRTGLPPFYPSGHNEDGLFGLVLRAVHPDSLIAHLPLALLHVPPTSSPVLDHPIWKGVARFEFHTLLWLLVRKLASMCAGSNRCELLGQALVEIGQLPTHEFWSVIAELRLELLATQIRLLHQFLQSRSGPPTWRDNVTRALRVLEGAALSQQVPTPEDLSGLQGKEAPRERARRCVRRFGELLGHWRPMYLAARRLPESGILDFLTRESRVNRP